MSVSNPHPIKSIQGSPNYDYQIKNTVQYSSKPLTKVET